MIQNLNSVVFFIPFIALIVAIVSLVLGILMYLRIKRIFRTAKASNIEELLALHTKTLEEFIKFKAESTQYMHWLDSRIKKKTTDAKTLRFNSFQGSGTGGQQSFSSVLANEEGNGVVITSMHTRERTNVFAKPIKNWQSEHILLEEEEKIISEAKKQENK